MFGNGKPARNRAAQRSCERSCLFQLPTFVLNHPILCQPPCFQGCFPELGVCLCLDGGCSSSCICFPVFLFVPIQGSWPKEELNFSGPMRDLNEQALNSLGTFQNGAGDVWQGEILMQFEPVTIPTSVYLCALLLLNAMKLWRGQIWLHIVWK